MTADLHCDALVCVGVQCCSKQTASGLSAAISITVCCKCQARGCASTFLLARLESPETAPRALSRTAGIPAGMFRPRTGKAQSDPLNLRGTLAEYRLVAQNPSSLATGGCQFKSVFDATLSAFLAVDVASLTGRS